MPIKLIILLYSIIIFAGCTIAPGPADSKNTCPPSWYLTPPNHELTRNYYGVGYAKRSNPKLAELIAIRLAHDDIYNKLNTKIISAIKGIFVCDYPCERGLIETEINFLAYFIENFHNTLSKSSITTKEIIMCEDRTVYVLALADWSGNSIAAGILSVINKYKLIDSNLINPEKFEVLESWLQRQVYTRTS
jgi:hypothetical protein